MIRLIAEAWMGLTSVTRAARFRDDWDNALNLTASGLGRSFFAAILSLPVIFFILGGYERMYAELVQDYQSTQTLGKITLTFLRIWLVFPVLAIILTRLTKTKHRIVHWIVLHNWSVLFLLLIQTGIMTLFLSGLADAETAYRMITSLYEIIRYFIYFRVAQVALGLNLLWTIPMAMVPILANQLLAYWIA